MTSRRLGQPVEHEPEEGRRIAEEPAEVRAALSAARVLPRAAREPGVFAGWGSPDAAALCAREAAEGEDDARGVDARVRVLAVHLDAVAPLRDRVSAAGAHEVSFAIPSLADRALCL